ncbi:hypothetical protein BBH99_12525 [Chryseobacterium contaminans]|uniref:Uncharacterized protein n=1 Tax=Chryseobacterium contaminans TaxID=1423959 RepID=A0ABX2X242_9FLAO|nr:hypothetical protein BBH99_12525 [Chryseobacterium contaminans]
MIKNKKSWTIPDKIDVKSYKIKVNSMIKNAECLFYHWHLNSCFLNPTLKRNSVFGKICSKKI